MANEPTLQPIDKREIRGITLETIVKYGGAIIAIIIAWNSITKKIDQLEKRIDDLEKAGAVRQKQIEALQTFNTATEIWKARQDEKNLIKNER